MTPQKNVEWWADRLRAHHGTRMSAVDAQLKHLVSEVGEAFKEYQIHTGANPRKPSQDRTQEISDEISDAIITGMIILQLWEPNQSPAYIVYNRLHFVTERMKRFDSETTKFIPGEGQLP